MRDEQKQSAPEFRMQLSTYVTLLTFASMASGCRSLWLTDVCRAQFADPTSTAAAGPSTVAITPEPETRTREGLPVARSYEELRKLFRGGNAALEQSRAGVDEIDGRQKALMDELEREAAWRSCDQPHPKCGLIGATMSTPEVVASFSATECKEPFGRTRKKLSRACSDKYTELFVAALRERYQLADAATVNSECAATPGCKGMLPYELLCLKSHNDELLRRFRELNGPLQEERDRRAQAYSQLLQATVERNRKLMEAFEQAQEQRTQRARDIEQARAAQLEQEQREREETRRRAAMAAALQAAGASLAAAAQAPTTYTPTSPGVGAVYRPSGCTSDFSCQYGWKCLKNAGSTEGKCAQAVDSFGTPTFAPPSTESVGPGHRQCWTLADCPSTFRCESGQCVK